MSKKPFLLSLAVFFGTDSEVHMDPEENAAAMKQQAHKLFLSKFMEPRNLFNFEEFGNWIPVLGEEPHLTVNRLVKNGFLAEATLAEKIALNFNGKQLKAFLNDRGLPVSGKKAILSERLAGSDGKTFEADLKDLLAYVCTEKGNKVAGAFLEKEEERKDKAQQETFHLLCIGDYVAAIRSARAFDSLNVYRRLPEDTTDFPKLEADIHRIVTAKWTGIEIIPNEMFIKLRAAVAMDRLWYDREIMRWLPGDYPVGEKHRIDMDRASILRFAEMEEYVENWQQNGYQNGSFICQHSNCTACFSPAGMIMPLGKKESLPWRLCSSRKICKWEAEPLESADQELDKKKAGWNLFSWWRK